MRASAGLLRRLAWTCLVVAAALASGARSSVAPVRAWHERASCPTGSPDRCRSAAQPAGTSVQLYLPSVARRATPPDHVCSTGLACGLEPGWSLACGGMGRVSDMLAGWPGGGGLVAVVGDGAAVFDEGDSSWRVQVGQELSGLHGLYVPSGGFGWSVGERGRIARLDRSCGCWAVDGPEAQLNGEIVLEAVMADDLGSQSWAVGRRSDRGELLWQSVVNGNPIWRDVSGWITDLPPLSDIHLLRRGPDGAQQAWLVSPDAGRVIVARLGGSATVQVEEEVPVIDADGASGRPREVAMRAGPPDEGWLVGASTDPTASLSGWRYVSPNAWQASVRLPGRSLVDLYFDGAAAGGAWWLGLSPDAAGSPVVQRADSANGQSSWSDVDRHGPPTPTGSEGGSQAVAALGGGDVLYAWGDDVWRFSAVRDDWVRVFRRRPLADVADGGAGAPYVLSARAEGGGTAMAGTAILRLDRGILVPQTVENGQSVSLTFPLLSALAADASGTVWAVGDDQALLARRAGDASWRVLSPPSAAPAVDLVDVATTADGAVWAAGTDDRGDGVVLRWHSGRWREAMRADGHSLLAVAALDGELAWAVGVGVGCAWSGASGTCRPVADVAARSDGVRPLRLVAVTAVRSPAGPVVWAAGEYYVLRMDPRGWAYPHDTYRLDGVPEGADLVDLVAAAPDDVWALAGCRPYPDAGRGVSLVSRFDGTRQPGGPVMPAHEALQIGLPMRRLALAASAGRRTLWLAGDWSTVLRFDGGTEAAPAPTAPRSPDLRCIAAVSPPGH